MKLRTKASPRWVALSTAAVIGIYSAGYMRTRTAAARFSDAPAVRRPAPAALRGASAPTPAPQQPSAPATAHVQARILPEAVGPRPSEPNLAATAAATDSRTPAAVIPGGDVVDAPAPVAAGPEVSVGEALAPPPPAAPLAASTSEPGASAAPAKPTYKDGTFTGWGYSRHGNIQAGVVIEQGRIANATIWLCMTRYPCSWIEKLPPQVAQRQSPDVDYVSGATESATAFYDAVVEALTKAAK